jgi:hypothetical protein
MGGFIIFNRYLYTNNLKMNIANQNSKPNDRKMKIIITEKQLRSLTYSVINLMEQSQSLSTFILKKQITHKHRN